MKPRTTSDKIEAVKQASKELALREDSSPTPSFPTGNDVASAILRHLA